jgi:hypothetical protein
MKITFLWSALSLLPLLAVGEKWRQLLDEDMYYGHIMSDDYHNPHADGDDGGACLSVKHKVARKGQKLVLERCYNDSPPDMEWVAAGWRFDDEGFVHSELDDSYCMQAGHDSVLKGSEFLRLYPCDETKKDVQQFVWINGGGIRPKANQDLCIVWRGVNGNFGTDPMVLKRCTAVDDRNDWSGDA